MRPRLARFAALMIIGLSALLAGGAVGPRADGQPGRASEARRDAIAWVDRGDVHRDAQRPRYALAAYVAAMRADASYARARVRFASLAHDFGVVTTHEALDQVRRGLRDEPNNVTALVLACNLARAVGDADGALEHALAAYEVERPAGVSSAVLYALGTAAYMAGDLEVAEQAFAERAATMPQELDNRLYATRIAFESWRDAFRADDDDEESRWRNAFFDRLDALAGLDGSPKAPAFVLGEAYHDAIRICIDKRDPIGASMWADELAALENSPGAIIEASLLARCAAGDWPLTTAAKALKLIDFTRARDPIAHVNECLEFESTVASARLDLTEIKAMSGYLLYEVEDYRRAYERILECEELIADIPAFDLPLARSAFEVAAAAEEVGDTETRNDALAVAAAQYRKLAGRLPGSVEYAYLARWLPDVAAGRMPLLVLGLYREAWWALGEATGAADAAQALDIALSAAPRWRPAHQLRAEAAHRLRAYGDAVRFYEVDVGLALTALLDARGDGDGQLSPDEASALPGGDGLDADGDGMVSIDELSAGHAFSAADFGATAEEFWDAIGDDVEIARSLNGLALAQLLAGGEDADWAAVAAAFEALVAARIASPGTELLAEVARAIADGTVVHVAFVHTWHARLAATLDERDTLIGSALEAQPALPEALSMQGQLRLAEAESYRRERVAMGSWDASAIRGFETRLSRAKQSYDATLAAARTDIQRAGAHDGRMMIAIAQGFLEDALSNAEAALSLDPDLSETRYIYAQLLRQEGEMARAHLQMRELLDRWPDHPQFAPNAFDRVGLGMPPTPPSVGGSEGAPRASLLPRFPPEGTVLRYAIDCRLENLGGSRLVDSPRFKIDARVLAAEDPDLSAPDLARLAVTVTWVSGFAREMEGLTFTLTLSSLLGVIDIDWGRNVAPDVEQMLQALIALVSPALAEVWVVAPSAVPVAVGEAWTNPLAAGLQGGGMINREQDQLLGIVREPQAFWLSALGSGRAIVERREQGWDEYEDLVRKVEAEKVFDVGSGRVTSATVTFMTLVPDPETKWQDDLIEAHTEITIKEE